MKGSPQDFKQGVGQHDEEIKVWTDADTTAPADPEDTRRSPPRLYLKKKDFKRYGYTMECPGCIRLARKASAPYHHNEKCRRRIESCVKRDDSDRWRRAELRRDHEDKNET